MFLLCHYETTQKSHHCQTRRGSMSDLLGLIQQPNIKRISLHKPLFAFTTNFLKL